MRKELRKKYNIKGMRCAGLNYVERGDMIQQIRMGGSRKTKVLRGRTDTFNSVQDADPVLKLKWWQRLFRWIKRIFKRGLGT